MKLSIVIPTKNEEENIVRVLNSIKKQINIDNIEVIISDADSTDNTILLSNAILKDRIICKGGLPAIGRNNGAKISNGEYILFLDSDVFFDNDTTLLYDCIKYMEEKCIWCCTVNIQCHSNYFKNIIVYEFNNIAQKLSKIFNMPFATGMFMLVKRQKFFDYGMFDENITYAEDFHFSRRIPSERFLVMKSKYVYTGDRRFKKMGTFNIVKLFLKTLFNSFTKKEDAFNIKYFEEN